MKFLSLLLLLLSHITLAGVGDIAGGNNRHFKQYLDSRYFYIDWPTVKYATNIYYELHDLCIENINQFGTKQLFNGKRRTMDRVYSDKNCIVKNDPMCDKVHRYVDDYVAINIYLKNREGIHTSEDIKEIIRDQFLVTVLLYEMPYCDE